MTAKMAESSPNFTELSDSELPDEIATKTDKKTKTTSEVKTAGVSFKEPGVSESVGTTVDKAVTPGENEAIAIPQPQQARAAIPLILKHILLLMLNNWQSLSICSRITTFILPYILMLLLFGWSYIFSVVPASSGRNQATSRSLNPAVDLSSHTSIKALHVYPDTNFTRKFTQQMLTMWDNGRKTDGHPLEFIFYSTTEALVRKLNKADMELAIQLPKDWDGAGTFDYKIIPSPRINIRDEKEMCSNDASVCSSSQTYLKSGLLAVQSSVDLTALGWKGSSERSTNLPPDGFHVKIRQMEGRKLHEYYPGLAEPVYLMAILLSLVPFVELFHKIFVLAVHEKAGVKNLLKMMGISETAYWLSKVLYYGTFVLYYAIVITVCLKIILFRYTNSSIVFVLLLLFGISFLALAYLLSAIVTSTKFTFVPYIGIYGLIIYNFFVKIYYITPLNTIRRGYFFVNVIAVLASLYASFLPDRAHDENDASHRDLPLDWPNVKPHGDLNTSRGYFENALSRDLNEDRVFYGIIFFLIDVIVYFLLGFYLNNVIPDKFGIRQSPMFLCLPSYWGLSKRARGNMVATSSSTTIDENFEAVPPGMFGAPAISIRNLRKNYTLCPWGRKNPDALKGISMDIYPGQVTAILGKNGAGKSTLFHILIGLIPPTAGTTNIFGYDSTNPADLVKIRRMVGVCLQHDVHFDFLTVLEHMRFFGKLRGFQGVQLDREVSQLIRDLGLEVVKNNRANKLSGGQKRKLSVGLALIGNPPIIFLDEPSAGLDPVARRDLWSLLQSRREGKVILLTTHFMDEADILADRKAIMNDGIVRCMGSSLFLKNRLGAGYILIIELTSASVDTTAIDQIIANYSSYVSSSRKKIAHELKYSFPYSEVSNFSSVFAQLELELGKSIKNLGISTTSLEDVFLKVCDNDGIQQVVSGTEQSNLDERVDLLGDLGVLKINIFSSLWAMIVIRLRRLARSPCYFFALFILPLLLTLLVSSINLTENSRGASHSRVSLRISDHKEIYKDARVAIHDNGDSALAFAQFLQSLGISAKTYAGGPEAWKNLAEPNEYMAALSVQMSRTTGNEALTGDVWLNDGVPHAAPILLDLLFKFYAKNVEGGSGRSVQVNTEYDGVSRQTQYPREATGEESIVTFLIPFVLGLTYSALLVELVYENEKQLRNHLRVNGLSPLIYYLSIFVVYFCLTFTLYLLLAVATWVFKILPLANPHSFVILFVFTTMSIVESMLLMFLLSLLMRKATIVHALYFPLYLLLIVVPLVILAVVKAKGNSNPEGYYYAVCLLNTIYIPFGFYNGVEKAWASTPPNNPVTFGSYNVYEVIGALVMIILHIVLYLGLLILINLGSAREALFQLCSRLKSPAPRLNSQPLDEDVIAEGQQIAEIFPSVGKNSDCVLIAKELRKSYGRTQILHGLSLLVEKGQVLGLLGHNGAGKTTTMRIITAEEHADSGQVKLGGYKIPEESNVAFRELGFCPQHDAFWENIRVSEHMNLYSAINGVPGRQRKILAFRILDGLSVREHERKYSQDLSGGTKRKLSYAIAMASAPQIVLMDEPSTGMDPQSKRFLWNTVLGSFKENRGAILTTHAMEEADVLSSKIAIMAKGALLCVGSPQHLKSKFGRNYTLEIKLESFVEATDNVEDAQSSAPTQFDFVFQHFPNCNLVEQFGNRAVFSIPIEGLRPLSETFALLEKLKDSHGIQEYAYTQVTLEQVYLTIDQAARNVME